MKAYFSPIDPRDARKIKIEFPLPFDGECQTHYLTVEGAKKLRKDLKKAINDAQETE